jgi:hypothetical protein
VMVGHVLVFHVSLPYASGVSTSTARGRAML